MDLESDELVRNLKASTEVAMYRRKPLAGESTFPKLYSLAVRTPRGVARTALSFAHKGSSNATFAVHGKDQLLLRVSHEGPGARPGYRALRGVRRRRSEGEPEHGTARLARVRTRHLPPRVRDVAKRRPF